MGLLQPELSGRLLYVLILKAVGTSALMIYALLWEAGNLVNQPEKRIGFYNFCLWNETVRELQCLKYKHLQMMGIGLGGIMLARICVYACLVFSIFYLLFVACMKYTEEREGLKLIHIILTIKLVMLSGGLGVFFLQTAQWIQLSDLSGGFLALLGTQALLLLQILTVTMYFGWAKHTHTRVSKPLY